MNCPEGPHAEHRPIQHFGPLDTHKPLEQAASEILDVLCTKYKY